MRKLLCITSLSHIAGLPSIMPFVCFLEDGIHRFYLLSLKDIDSDKYLVGKRVGINGETKRKQRVYPKDMVEQHYLTNRKLQSPVWTPTAVSQRTNPFATATTRSYATSGTPEDTTLTCVTFVDRHNGNGLPWWHQNRLSYKRCATSEQFDITDLLNTLVNKGHNWAVM